MPPKRKAPEDNRTATDASPSKRVTRSTSYTLQPHHELPKPSPQRKKPTPSQKSATSLSPQKPPHPHHTKPPPKGDESDEGDELNLSPSKPLVHPSTPGPRAAPRVVMNYVEIITPRGFTTRAAAASTSPSIHSVAGVKVMATSVLKAPSTPSRQLRGEPMASATFVQRPLTPSRAQLPAIPQASPSRLRYQPGDVPATPGRITARPSSPKKGSGNMAVLGPLPVKLPNTLPTHLVPCLRLQKRVILTAFQSSTSEEDLHDEPDSSTNATAYAQLQDLLHGTSTRAEGNSCLLLGPRGSGKTSLVERAIRNIPESPIVIRLSGHAQHNDRLALREIARQLSQQTGKLFFRDAEEDANEEEPNPFLDREPSTSLPPPAHLPALISVLPTLSRPTVVVLDAFDLFAQHARQSLLYCLLDTVQSCKVGQGSSGLAVIGVTSRIDAINLLEKRVKSRFSGRMFRTAPPCSLPVWINISRRFLDTPVNGPSEWRSLWSFAVQKFLEDRSVTEILKDTFALTRDVRMLKQMLTSIVVDLQPTSPFPTAVHISSAVSVQRLREKFFNLQGLSYPSICLLIAARHAHTAGHDVITFEMLYDAFREQFRASSAAPIQIEGGSIGMVRCTRDVLARSFEELVGARMFISVAAASSSIAPEFVRYRCLVEMGAVKQAVNLMGQTNLKKWLNKGT